MRRVLTPELMDDPGVPRDDLALSLRYIRAVNRRLGGVSSLLFHLHGWSRDWPKGRPITLLDIATGSADLPIAAVQWARRAGHDLRVTAVDLHPTTLDLAREHIARTDSSDSCQTCHDCAALSTVVPLARGAHAPPLSHPLSALIELRQANALHLMDHFAPASFDYVHAGLFLHHLPEIEILTVLRIMDRLSRAGLIWNDLVRSRVGYATINLMTLGLPRIIRHDATVSVRAGFTRREALDLATRAGITRPDYRWNLLTHRFTVTAVKKGAW